MIPPDEVAPGANLNANLKVLDVTAVPGSTTVEIKVQTGLSVMSVKYYIYPIGSGTAVASGTITSAETVNSVKTFSYVVNGLSAGATYTLRAIPYTTSNGSGDPGISYEWVFSQLSVASGAVRDTVRASAQYTGNGDLAINIVESQKTNISVFKLSNPNKNKSKFIIAEKTLPKVNTSKGYFAFGTTVYMMPTANSAQIDSGGIMFFSNNNGQTGYYISIQSADSAAKYKQNAFRILKVKDGKVSELFDSQRVESKRYGSVFNGEAYKIDILVSYSAELIKIRAYIDGFLVEAQDTPDSSDEVVDMYSKVLPRTNKVSLVAAEGTVYFDYVYGMNISYNDFINPDLFNIYDGKFSDALITSAYGEKVLQNSTKADTEVDIEEFGTCARELKYFKAKFNSPPGFPIHTTTGGNKQAKVLGATYSAFGAEMYVLNNASTYVNLSDNDANSLWVIGKSVSRTSEIEYIDDSAGKFAAPSPVIFDSTWIQKDSDAVALAEWIKSTWSKKQMIIDLDVTGNPLLSVGDVIVVSYPYHSITTSSKYLITKISQSYSAEGLTTKLSCRTL